MGDFYINTDKVIQSSQDIISSAKRLKVLKDSLENIKLGGGLDGPSRKIKDKSINRILENVSDEAAKMNSLGDALKIIADTYQETEKSIVSIECKIISSSNLNAKYTNQGTDKRNWWNKFWDWITNKEPDAYDTSTMEQEKAADAAIKKELWDVLQNEKYSQENWDDSSIDERKQILQDYMNEVIDIYGLQDVKSNIKWDPDAEYNNNEITWGYYTHRKHSVTLNEKALTDSVGNWDSYDLLETVSHELRHANQHEAVDHPTKYMVSKETIDIWEENFDNYISSETDYDQYREQPVEVDARDFQVNRDDKR